MPKTEKQVVGDKGEAFAAAFLESKGFTILTRNYRRPWGEIDIVAKKAKILHFVEVKTVSRGTNGGDVTHETDFSPEDNVHFMKRQRFGRIIETFLLEENVPHETSFQIDLISVYSLPNGKMEVDYLEDILL